MVMNAHMDNELLGQIIRDAASSIEEDQPGFWKFEFEDRPIFVLTDQNHNRIRVMTPVADDELPEEIYKTLLTANYDRALDARYCLNEGVLWSAYIHPLGQLSKSQFLDGLKQVVTLANNFGKSYSSSDLVFGG